MSNTTGEIILEDEDILKERDDVEKEIKKYLDKLR